MRRVFLSSSAAALAAFALAPVAAGAQDFPSRPITLVVPFAAGGGVDVMARLLAEPLRGLLGQNVIVENKPGASGMVGAQAVVRARPDGYTLLLGSAGETAINAYVYKERMAYRPERDLAPVSLVTRVPNVLVAGPSLKAGNVGELVARAKASPGQVSYATSGVGNPQHLNGALLASLAGVDMMHVPYKGAAAQLADVASGNVAFTFVSYAGAASFIRSGRVRALAVTSGSRAPFAPDIPAIAETPGLAGYDLSNWFGLFAPRGTPADVIARINQAVSTVLADPAMVARLREQGGEPEAMRPQAFADFIRTENAKYADIVAKAAIVAE